MELVRTTLATVSRKVVTLTSFVFSLTMTMAFAAFCDPSFREELKEYGFNVRNVASIRDDQKERAAAATRHTYTIAATILFLFHSEARRILGDS